uniref:Low-density lipoprotein receptor domain class A n=1 Tax=Musca domestica TaxID=7370 RepID=T1PC06_MUSDO
MEERDSAVVITQRWNTTLPGFYSSNKINYDCEFKVLSSEDAYRNPRGIYTVINHLKFRQHPETNNCLDYIQFRSGNRSPSDPICNIGGPEGRVFDERYRDLTVFIHIDKSRMITEPLELSMVLTAHSECKNPDDFLCNRTDPFSCISRHFVRDNVTNCECDEVVSLSCSQDVTPALKLDTTSVALSAITSLIFTMVGVGCCVWICWKYWNCITVHQRSHNSNDSVSGRRHSQRQHWSQQQQRNEIRDVPVIELPTAPTFDIETTIAADHSRGVHGQSHHDPSKDLPPSYEELFPDR